MIHYITESCTANTSAGLPFLLYNNNVQSVYVFLWWSQGCISQSLNKGMILTLILTKINKQGRRDWGVWCWTGGASGGRNRVQWWERWGVSLSTDYKLQFITFWIFEYLPATVYFGYVVSILYFHNSLDISNVWYSDIPKRVMRTGGLGWKSLVVGLSHYL